MPTTKSAAKRMRTSEVKRTANRADKSRVATVRRQLLAAITAGDKSKSDTLYREYSSLLDRAAKHGSIKPNNASRHKSRMAAQLAKS